MDNNISISKIQSHSALYNAYHKHQNACIFSFLFISSLILKYFSVFIPSLGIQLSFSTIPLIAAGIYFGPVIGFFNGVLIDLMSFLFFGNSYQFSFLYTLQTGLYGLVSGLSAMGVYKYSKNITNADKIKNIFKIVFISTFINSFVLGTAFTSLYLQTFLSDKKLSMNFLLFTRLMKETVKIPITVAFLFLLVRNK